MIDLNSVVKKIEWNSFLLLLQKYGTEYVNNDLVDEIANKTGNGHTIIHRQLDNNIPTWIQSGLKYKPMVLQIFASQPSSVGTIHKDGIQGKSALNIPICNCDSGLTEWFDGDFKELKISNEYTQIRLIDGLYEYEPTISININQPCVLNTDIWHRVHNTNQNYRYMLSIRFEGNPSFLELSSRELFYV